MNSFNSVAKLPGVVDVVQSLLADKKWDVYHDGARCCPGCGHKPLVSRIVDVPLVGNTQVACPCYAAALAEQAGACTCKWTHDE